MPACPVTLWALPRGRERGVGREAPRGGWHRQGTSLCPLWGSASLGAGHCCSSHFRRWLARATQITGVCKRGSAKPRLKSARAEASVAPRHWLWSSDGGGWGGGVTSQMGLRVGTGLTLPPPAGLNHGTEGTHTSQI